MRNNTKRPLVPGGPAIPGYGSGHGNGGAGGAMNPRVGHGYHNNRILALANYNTRTLRTDVKMTELEEAISKLHWDVIGLSEVRREGEDTITLDSGNLLYFREGDQQSVGGVGFIVHKISSRYSMTVIQVYAPTSKHTDDEVEAMYEEISRAMHSHKTHYTIVMGDFNAKLGKRCGDELRVGQFGVGERNDRGRMLADFMERENLYMMNSFFRKPVTRRWTWISPDGKVKNEIDFIMSTKKQIFNDVSVINAVKTGSDHRLVRGTLNINVKLERSRLIKSTLRPVPAQIQNPERFQLQNRFEYLENSIDVDDLNDLVVDTVRTVGSKHFKARRTKLKKLSAYTLELMDKRHEMRLQDSADAFRYRQLNRQISKSLTSDLRHFNTERIKEAIERNKGSKVFARDLSIGQSQLTRLNTEDGSIISSTPEILREIESFYRQLYSSRTPGESRARDPRAKLTRHYTEDIPDVSLYEIRIALKQLKNNKAAGDDGITTELLRAGGTPVLKVLQKLFNSVIHQGKTPKAWSRSEVILFFKKGDKTLLKNYRPISLLSHIYKLFSRVITNRLARRLDDFQPPEQAGFRKGFRTIDHIHTLRQIIQKTEEYNRPLCLAFVDYEKAFDSIETWAVLQSLQRCQVKVPIPKRHYVGPSTESELSNYSEG
ncbi:hypothetical protein evm_014675 [Chilo suppressalis]|nr:hypothetical protein evm_014675 [Chilo suppressalis]